MTTSQQSRYGRHARLDEPAATAVPWQRPSSENGSGRSDDEPAGPNPYLPCEDAAPDVRLAPGGLPGTLALLAGAAGVALATLFPLFAIAVWPLTILGIVLGVAGLRRVRAGVARNRVTAAAGIVLSVVGLAVCAYWLSIQAAAGVSTGDPVGQNAVPAAVR